jgi:hypothetical protein
MPIKHLAKNGPVGVLKRCCTIPDDRIRALKTPDAVYFNQLPVPVAA